MGDDDKENCFDASPVLARRKSSGRRSLGLSDLQSPPMVFPSKEIEYVGDMETTPVPQEKVRKRKLSLNRRVSFAEKTTVHEFTRDEEYRTPPKGKLILSKETEEIIDNIGKLGGEVDPIPRAQDDATAPLLKRQKDRQSIVSLMPTSATPHGGAKGGEVHPRSCTGKSNLGSPLPSGIKETEPDGPKRVFQENESAVKLRKDLEELMLFQSLRQQRLFSSPASSEKGDNLERSGPVDMRSFYQLQDGSDGAEDDSVKMDLTFALPNKQVVQELLASNREATAEVFRNHHYPYIYPGSAGVQDLSMMEDSVGTKKQNSFKLTPTTAPANVALCFNDTTAELAADKRVGSIMAGFLDHQSLADNDAPQSKSKVIREPHLEEVVDTDEGEESMEGDFGGLEGFSCDFAQIRQHAASVSPWLNDTQAELTVDMTDDFITDAVPVLQALVEIDDPQSETANFFEDPLIQKDASNKTEALMEGGDNDTTIMSCDFPEKSAPVDGVAFGSGVPTWFTPDGTITAALPFLQSLVDIDDRSQETENILDPHPRQLVGVHGEELEVRDGSDHTAEVQSVVHTTNTGLNDDSSGRVTSLEKATLCHDDTTAHLILGRANGFITEALPDLESLLFIDGPLSERKSLLKPQMLNMISKAENLPMTDVDKFTSQFAQAASVSAGRQVSAVPVDTVKSKIFPAWTMEEKVSILEKPSDYCVQSSKLRIVLDEAGPSDESVQVTTSIRSAPTGCKYATNSILEQESLKETEGTGPPGEQVHKTRNEDTAVFQGAISFEENDIGTVRIDAKAHQQQVDVQVDSTDIIQGKPALGDKRVASPKQFDQADHTAALASGGSSLFNVQTNKAGVHVLSSRSQGSPLAVRSLNFHEYQHVVPDSVNTPLRDVSTVGKHQVEQPVMPEAVISVLLMNPEQTVNCEKTASDFYRPGLLNCGNNRNVTPTAKVGSKVLTSTDATPDGNSSQHADDGDTLPDELLPELTSGFGKLKSVLSIQRTRIHVTRKSEVNNRVVTKLWQSESVYHVEELGQAQVESEATTKPNIPKNHKQSTEDKNLETVQGACRLKGGDAALVYWAAHGQQAVHDREKTCQDLEAKISTFHRNGREEEKLLTDMARLMNLLSEKLAATKQTLDQLKTKQLLPTNVRHEDNCNDKTRLFEIAQARARRKKLELDLLKDLDKKSKQDAHIEKEALFIEESNLRRLRNQLSAPQKFTRRNGDRSVGAESGGRERDLETLVSLQTWTICSPRHHPRPVDSFEMVLNFEDCIELRFVKRNRDAPVVLSMEVEASALEKAYPSMEARAMFPRGLSLIDHRGPLSSIPQAVQEADLHIGRALDLLKEFRHCKSIFPHLALIRLVPPTAEITGTRALLTFVDLAKNVKITSEVLMAPASMGGALFGYLKHTVEVKGGGLPPTQRANLVKDLEAITVAPGFFRMERLCQVIEDHICMI